MFIQLTEHTPVRLVRDTFPDTAAEILWRDYKKQVAIEFPSPKTNGEWQLTSQGWAGYIPLTADLGLELQPKVPLSNLFRMLEYAYNLDLQLLDGLVDCQSLPDFYERLAHILARRVLDRGRQGFHRAYVERTDQLPYIRGEVNLLQVLRRPWQVKLESQFQDHTVDIPDNQILAWTLATVARSGLCTERTLPTIRRAYRVLQGVVAVQPFGPQDCAGRIYNRLNEDYRPLHALCRFFLQHSGPGHQAGDQAMAPFLIDMAQLYERFVAGWLQRHLPSHLSLQTQERVDLEVEGGLHFRIDLVLSNRATGQPLSVLDTKYKATAVPATEDMAQIIAYAQAKGCHEAILIYPAALARPLDTPIGDIRLRALSFGLDNDLEQNGRAFLQALSLTRLQGQDN